MNKVLILGKSGQVASNLVKAFSKDFESDVLTLDRETLDFSQPKTIFGKLQDLQFKPDVVVNCVAYTAVDKAEDEKLLCEDVNYTSVVEITRFVKEIDALFIHYSTDYVFDGEGEHEFSESNTRNLKPKNFYGRTKLDAERAIQNYDVKHLILRTSWVYNHTGRNFLRTILNLSQQMEELKVVNDQVGSPTYAFDIAKATTSLIKTYMERDNRAYDGLYHLVPKEQISWFQFAIMILESARKMGIKFVTENIIPVSSDEFAVKVKRPQNSRLNTDKIEKEFGIKLPPIQVSLEKCISKIVQTNW